VNGIAVDEMGVTCSTHVKYEINKKLIGIPEENRLLGRSTLI
jgi:hypothetical protein